MAAENIFTTKAIHPGGILLGELKTRRITQKEFATLTGLQASHLNEIIKGKRGINIDIAKKIESVLGMPYCMWLNFQKEYEANCYKAIMQPTSEYDAVVFLEECKKVLSLKPILEALDIVRASCMEQVRVIKETFSFNLFDIEKELGVSGCYKHSEKCAIDEQNMNTWLALNWMQISKSSPNGGFVLGNEDKAADEIAYLANQRKIAADVVEFVLNKYGITYLVQEKLNKTPIDAYSTIVNDNPYITVTYRYNDLDKLVFDVLHELCHIGRHLGGNQKAFISVEGADYSKDPREEEANTYARNKLIPENVWKSIIGSRCNSLNPYVIINTIAKKAILFGISPSIAVARYKNEAKWYKTPSYKSPKILTK
ncbi:MAG: helix-turn-helix domain-containing protein [Marinilabiliaceae bacterium]|nr:helix-turn-helix domain-containing protein [Marinilabiliaceae bacterium]